MFTEKQFSEFLAGYIAALLWSSSDTVEGEQLESLEGFELNDTARVQCAAECRAFMEQNASDLAAYAESEGMPGMPDIGYQKAGLDFWLTRVGHGVGFWDRGLGELGERLTAASKQAGERWPFVGDDGEVYL